MTKFCDNKLCPQHEFEAAPITEILRDNKKIKMSRHELYISVPGSVKVIALCACCYAAYLMCRQEKSERQAEIEQQQEGLNHEIKGK